MTDHHRHHHRHEHAGNVAAIDCGTNATRLLVADANGRALERHATITGLGRGVDATKRLADDGIARVVDVLHRYGQRLDHYGIDPATDVRVIATSAARDATNRDELFAQIEATVGAPAELLTGLEEGRLGFLGATADLDPALGPYLVVDIGGGSTELTVAPTDTVSIDLGSVRVTERYLRSDPPDPGELSDALSVLKVHLDDAVRDHPATLDAARLVGLSGTVVTVAAVELGLFEPTAERLHHFVLTRAAAEDVFRTLATEAKVDRAANPGLDPARVDVIVGGALVLVGIMRYFDFDECLVSVHDLLDGVVAELLLARRRRNDTP